MFYAMCGPQKVDQHFGTHPNEAWWASQVVCAVVEDVPSGPSEDKEANEGERFYKFIDENGKERWIKSSRMLLSEPPDFGSDLSRTITAFTEVRIPYWTSQPHSWITYHAFTLLELDHGQMFAMCERKTDMLELVVGKVEIPMAFFKAFRAMGPGRNPGRCAQEPRQPVTSRISLRQLLGWIDGPVEERWVPYDLLKANCQHFAADLQSFLLDPAAPEHHSENPLLAAPLNWKEERASAMASVARNPKVLKYLPDRLRRDREVVLLAVSNDGNALKYVPEQLRADPEVAMAALRQNGYALPYVHASIRQRRDVVMAAVAQNGYILCYTVERHRQDRDIVLAAVRADAHALRYVSAGLRYDPEVMMAASFQNPLAVFRSAMC
mmetsp:Transcript_103286/g.296518  ORF Transcript_103286/g.296518 Transcript_103286/m.296518 type:complete len:381 (-) Transcript_103286:43-1185(-)